MGPGGSLERWLRWSAHPCGGVCSGHAQYLAVSPSSLEVEVGVLVFVYVVGFPGGAVVKNPSTNASNIQFDPWAGKISWRREWLPTPVFLPGKSH